MNEQKTTDTRLHPLVAGAAASVILVSVLGVAAITGVLPNSYGNATSTANTASAQQVQWAPVPMQARPVSYTDQYASQYANQSADCVQATVAENRSVVPTTHRAQPTTRQAVSSSNQSRVVRTAQPVSNNYAYENRRYRETPASVPAPAPQPRYSPVGIATGAVVGGLIGNQIGGGSGKALATVAGAVGGGYLGNMAGQRYGY